jgi:hypothetical protein
MMCDSNYSQFKNAATLLHAVLTKVYPQSWSLLLIEWAVRRLYVTWSMSPGRCHLVDVTWSMSPGRCHLVDVTWSMSPGRCHLVDLTWSISPGRSHLVDLTTGGA